NPATNGRFRRSGATRDLVDRRAVSSTKLTRHFSLRCFHFGKRSRAIGRTKRPTGLEPVPGDWKSPVLPLHHGRAPIAYPRGSVFVGAALGRSRRNCGTRRRVLLDTTALALGHNTPRRVRPRTDPPARRLRDAAANDCAALLALDPLPAERRHGGVGAGARRLRRVARARPAGRPSHPPARRAAGLARHVLLLAPPVRLRRGTQPPALPAAPRAPDVLRR